MQLGAKETENERFSHYFTKTYRKTASLIANSLKAVSRLEIVECLGGSRGFKKFQDNPRFGKDFKVFWRNSLRFSKFLELLKLSEAIPELSGS
jgi:hypothetical protein